ncbi:MAG: helix-turn-helix transcriptional regulator [Agathobacter sp.]|nr:helix-turn-helix transcriptional regulator [Agathobacter sp.]
MYVGFPSQSYFGRVFKKYTGMTPLKYREAHRLHEFSSQSGR